MNDMQVQQLAKSIGTMGDERLAGAKVEYYNDGKLQPAEAGDGSRQLAQIVSANSGQVVVPLKPFPGTVLYAEMVSEANSDAPGPVLARIEQGPLKGATLIGQFKAGQESLVIDFRRMTVVKNEGGRQVSKTIDIEAYAVNTDTLSTAVATEVDRHLFQKIALTAATTFVQGFGNAIGQSGATVSRDPYGTTIAYPTLDTRQQLYMAAGQTAGQVGSIVQREFGNRPTTIKVRAGTPVGIMFL
jgi:intracellular multiplication protein IcmE